MNAIKAAPYLIIVVLLVLLYAMWKVHNNDIKTIEQQNITIATQKKSIEKLDHQIKLNDELIAINDKQQQQLNKESQHAKDLYERYFRMYKNDCASQPVPAAVVKRLRKQNDNNRDGNASNTSK